MSSTARLLVSGASGQLGQQVLEFLIEQGAQQVIATSRDPSKLERFRESGVELRQADLDQPASLLDAFRGAERLLLISTDSLGRRVAQHEAAVVAAKRAGVKHIIYTSVPSPENSASSIAPEHLATEKLIEASGLTYTILRNHLYVDNFLHSLPPALEMGKLFAAVNNQKGAGYVTREDCARVAAAVHNSNDTENRILDVSGPAVVHYSEIAKWVSDLMKRPLEFVPVPFESHLAALENAGLPPVMARVLATFDHAISKGEYASTSQTVQEWTGQEPISVGDFLKQKFKP
ncbi:MAG: SDR family oxidoreductase [Proteobacteria bacterium]|nr:MAG: SDR family oxidoreductase [Pseudomonadota bacterium]